MPRRRRIRSRASPSASATNLLLHGAPADGDGDEVDGASGLRLRQRLAFWLLSLSVLLAKGRRQVFPAVGSFSGLLWVTAAADFSSDRRRRRPRSLSSFLLIGGITDIRSTNSKRCDLMAPAHAARPKCWGSSAGGWRGRPVSGSGSEPVKMMNLRTCWGVYVIFFSSRVFSAKRQRCTVYALFNTVFLFVKKKL